MYVVLIMREAYDHELLFLHRSGRSCKTMYSVLGMSKAYPASSHSQQTREIIMGKKDNWPWCYLKRQRQDPAWFPHPHHSLTQTLDACADCLCHHLIHLPSWHFLPFSCTYSSFIPCIWTLYQVSPSSWAANKRFTIVSSTCLSSQVPSSTAIVTGSERMYDVNSTTSDSAL